MDVHGTKCLTLGSMNILTLPTVIARLTHSSYTTKTARIRHYTMLSTFFKRQDVQPGTWPIAGALSLALSFGGSFTNSVGVEIPTQRSVFSVHSTRLAQRRCSTRTVFQTRSHYFVECSALTAAVNRSPFREHLLSVSNDRDGNSCLGECLIKHTLGSGCVRD